MFRKAGPVAWTAMLTAGVGALLGVDRTASAQTHDMKIGFVTINDSQHSSAKLFAAEIDKRTNGRLKARIFPAAQLGKIPRQIEGLQLATQEVLRGHPLSVARVQGASYTRQVRRRRPPTTTTSTSTRINAQGACSSWDPRVARRGRRTRGKSGAGAPRLRRLRPPPESTLRGRASARKPRPARSPRAPRAPERWPRGPGRRSRTHHLAVGKDERRRRPGAAGFGIEAPFAGVWADGSGARPAAGLVLLADRGDGRQGLRLDLGPGCDDALFGSRARPRAGGGRSVGRRRDGERPAGRGLDARALDDGPAGHAQPG